MNPLEIAQRSFDAWNRHDAEAILALHAEGGTYSTPRAGGALTGQAIANYAKAVFTAYPDMSLGIPEGAWSPEKWWMIERYFPQAALWRGN
jgi:SnoaL-like domain